MDNKNAARWRQLRKQALEKVFSRMNGQQRKAVFAVNGPVLILAGAGSGKTTVLVNRIANMIRFGDAYSTETIDETLSDQDFNFLEDFIAGKEQDEDHLQQLIAHQTVRPWNILAITFTNKAAGELKERLSGMLGEQAQDIQASTFHSACVRMLRRNIDKLGYSKNFTIYDTDDSLRLIKDCLKELNVDEKMFTPKSILHAIGREKDSLHTVQYCEAAAGEDYRKSIVSQVYRRYQEILKRSDAVDFDDIIVLTVRLLQEYPDVLEYYQNRWRYIMVDEYQDTNHAQYKLVSLLAEKHHNLCVVGDDDQSIYKFRGATIENIMNFEEQFGNALVIRLEENYRCTQTILDVANSVIANNVNRKGKTLWTHNDKGDPIKVYRASDELHEAVFIADTVMENVQNGAKFSDHAVLYRMNSQSNSIEKSFVKHGISYRIIGGLRFYERKEIKDIIAYLSLINNPNDNVRLRRIINEPKRGIGNATLAAATDIAEEQGVSIFEVLSHADEYEHLYRKSKVLISFANMIQQMMDMEADTSLEELIHTLLRETGYIDSLMQQGFEGRTRIENIEELVSNIIKYEQDSPEPSLAGFLEEVSLYTDIDRMNEDDDCVTLMTMHSAKGLEFPYVFIAGMEEGIFPGTQVIYNPDEVEEERRLCYVAITRAKKKLYLTNANIRMIFGQTKKNSASRFIKELPAELIDYTDSTLQKIKQEPTVPFVDKRKLSARVGKEIGIAGKMETNHLTQQIKVGTRVQHKVFGEGLVVGSTPMAGDVLLEISFDKVGTKKIMGNFAKLSILE